MLMTMEDESNNKTQLKLPKIFTLAGFALIALAIFSFFMSVLCGLGGSGSCDGDSSNISCTVFLEFLQLLLHKS